MNKLTKAQMQALNIVSMHAKRGTYMPFVGEARSFEAAERKGYLEYRSVDQGSEYNGYALTNSGRAALTSNQEGNDEA